MDCEQVPALKIKRSGSKPMGRESGLLCNSMAVGEEEVNDFR